MFDETESDEVLPDILVFLTEEGRRGNSLKLPVLTQPLSEPEEGNDIRLDPHTILQSTGLPVVSLGICL